MSDNITHRSDSSHSENLLTEKEQELLPHQRKIKRKKHHVSPIIVNLVDCKYVVVKQVVKNLRFKSTKDHNAEWDLTWTDNIVTPETLARMRAHQKINHFPAMFNLSRKNFLARNLNKMQKQFPDAYSFYPKTWTLPAEYNQLRQHLQAENNSIVIAKPEAGSQGRGIFLAKSIEEFTFGEHYVVQKYVKKPFLIEGLKFDLRVYVLVAGCDPLRIYIYKEGLARFATEPYSSPKKENLSNLYMHLTNYAINKSSAKFQFNQSSERMDIGHKRSLSSILQKLEMMNQDSQKIWRNICDIITKTLISVQPILAHTYRSCQPDNIQNNMCFEVLGFDVMLDSELKPIILEANYTPSFTTDTPLDLQIKQNLLKDTLILLNLSNKAKNDALAAKKREMIERTLTGKKIWHTKEEREYLLDKINAKRDAWELHHLGNYQRVYPPLKPQKEVSQNYTKYLSFSQSCYLSGTGGNIKRNNKVSIPTSIVNTTTDISDSVKPAQKYTKNDQLQKIYMKKSKPMVYQKLKSNSSQIKQQHQVQRQPITQCRNLVNKSQIQGERGKAYESVEKNAMKNKFQIRAFTAQKLTKESQKRNSSVKNGRVMLSRIYNIGFRQMKPSR